MNKSLEALTKPESYASAIEHYRSVGIAEATITKIIAARIKEAKDLYEGRCPQCGEPSARYVDYQRQQGDKGGAPGVWVQYRCSTQPPPGQVRPAGVCNFMLDIVEGETAS